MTGKVPLSCAGWRRVRWGGQGIPVLSKRLGRSDSGVGYHCPVWVWVGWGVGQGIFHVLF